VLTRLLERSGLTVKLLKAPDDRPTDFVVTLSGEAARKDSSRASRVHLVVGEALWADGTGELPLGDDVHTSRYYALTAHYRSPWLLSLNGLFAAKMALQTLQSQTRGLAIAGQPLSQPLSELSPGARAQRQSFYAALGEDLNTPKALCILWKVAHSDLPPNERRALLLDFDQALELRLDAAKTDADLPAEADALIEQRAEARRKKDWPRSDSLREELSSLGLEAHDTPEGSTYRRRDQPV
jgi:cysteinyl-tRNA synthetase